MIGVIVPAHDEASLIGECLASLEVAARHPRLHGEPVRVFVAADACRDSTARLARRAGAAVSELAVRNVGAARREATARAIARGAGWIASTDADSVVAPDWLAEQLALRDRGVHAVCGVVEVRDWLDHPAHIQRSFASAYVDIDGHSHIHGACLGFSREAYLATGGWQALRVHEDVGLVEAIEAAGYEAFGSAAVRVTTSARRNARARGGFGDHLISLGAAGVTHAAAC